MVVAAVVVVVVALGVEEEWVTEVVATMTIIKDLARATDLVAVDLEMVVVLAAEDLDHHVVVVVEVALEGTLSVLLLYCISDRCMPGLPSWFDQKIIKRYWMSTKMLSKNYCDYSFHKQVRKFQRAQFKQIATTSTPKQLSL